MERVNEFRKLCHSFYILSAEAMPRTKFAPVHSFCSLVVAYGLRLIKRWNYMWVRRVRREKSSFLLKELDSHLRSFEFSLSHIPSFDHSLAVFTISAFMYDVSLWRAILLFRVWTANSNSHGIISLFRPFSLLKGASRISLMSLSAGLNPRLLSSAFRLSSKKSVKASKGL